MSNYEAKPMLSFVGAVSAVLSKYVTFTGRARRSEYWWFVLFQIVATTVAMILDGVLGITFGVLPYGVLYCLVVLGLFLPALAVTVRRLHDINKSGWNYLWILIPLIGAILLLVWTCFDSEPETNKYGDSPKYFQVS